MEEISRKYYDETYYRGHEERLVANDRFTRVKIERLFSILHPAAGESILDLGSGVGTVMIALANVGAKTFGADYSYKSLVLAKNNFVRHVSGKKFGGTCCDGRCIAIKNDSLDAIAAVDFTEHLEDEILEPTFRECLRILRREGRLAVYTPSVTHIFERLKKRNIILKEDKSHVGLRTMTQYVDLLQKCGFCIDDSWFAPTDIPVFNLIENMLMPLPFIGGLARRRICIRAIKPR